MRHNSRYVKLAFALIGTLILIVIVSSRLIFSSDRLSALVLPQISRLLNRDVSAEQVELSFFPTIGIRITGFRVSNPDYRKFDSPYLLDAKAVVIDAKILPLLKNRLEINNVIFYSPTIFIEENQRGRLNTEQLLSETFYRENRNVRGSLSSLLLSNFEISNGNIIWYNGRTGISAKFLNIDFASKIKTVVEENKLVLNSRLNVERFELWKDNSNLYNGTRINASSKLDYDTRHDQVHIESDHLSVFGIELHSSVYLAFYPQTQISFYTASTDSSARSLFGFLPELLQNQVIEESIKGKLSLKFRYELNGSTPEADLYAHLKNFRAELRSGDTLSVGDLDTHYSLQNDSSAFRLYMPGAVLGENYASLNLVLSPPQFATIQLLVNVELRKLAHSLEISNDNRFSGSIRAKYNLNYGGSVKNTKASGLVVFENALAQIPVGIDTLYRGEVDGSISIRDNRATINKMLVRLGASDLVLSGTMTNYQSVFLGRGAIMPSLKLSVLSRTFSTIGLLPHLNFNLGRGSLGWLPTANVSLLFSIGKCVLPFDTLSRVTGNVDLLNYFVRLNKMDYSSSSGNFSVSGWSDYSQEDKTTFSIRTRVSTSNFGGLIRRYLGRVDVSGGAGAGLIALNGVYDDSGKVDLATLGGKGALKISNAIIKDYSVLNKLYTFLGADGRDSVKVASSNFNFDITDGRVYLNRLVSYGKPFDFRLDGWHGFDGTLDYKLTMRIYPPVSTQVGSHLKTLYPDLTPNADGGLSLGLVAGGTTSDARFTIVALGGKIAGTRTSQPQYVLLSR